VEYRQLNWERNNKYLIQVGGLIRKDFQTSGVYKIHEVRSWSS